MANIEVTKKVPLELICILLLRERDMYGYEIVQELERCSKNLLSINLASVYVSLKRLGENGHVSAYNKIPDDAPTRLRVYYRLAPSADAYQEKLYEEYRRTVIGVQNIFDCCMGDIYNGKN